MCGIVGIYGHPEAATLSYLWLYALQHRGQEGGGIIARNGNLSNIVRERGLIADIFADKEKLASLPRVVEKLIVNG